MTSLKSPLFPEVGGGGMVTKDVTAVQVKI